MPRTEFKQIFKSLVMENNLLMYSHFLHFKWEIHEGKSESRGTGKTKVGKELFIFA